MSALATIIPPVKKITTTLHPHEFPDLYVMAGDGKCMEPAIMDGQRLYVSSVERYRPGDFVIVFKKPEYTIPGDHQMIVKKLIYAPPPAYWSDPGSDPGIVEPPTVIVEMINPNRRLVFRAWELMGIHKVVGSVPDDHKTFKVDDDWIRAKHRERVAKSGGRA